MKITITKNTRCPSDKSPAQCSNIIVNKLQLKFSCKLRADKKTDTVNGYVTIDHTPNNHIIEIHFYETDESPNKKHLTTMKKLSLIPSIKQCEECLE